MRALGKTSSFSVSKNVITASSLLKCVIRYQSCQCKSDQSFILLNLAEMCGEKKSFCCLREIISPSAGKGNP